MKDDIFEEEKSDSIPTIDDFLEEENKSKRKKKDSIFLEDDYDDIFDYDYDEDDISRNRGSNKTWSEGDLSEVDDIFDDEDF